MFVRVHVLLYSWTFLSFFCALGVAGSRLVMGDACVVPVCRSAGIRAEARFVPQRQLQRQHALADQTKKTTIVRRLPPRANSMEKLDMTSHGGVIA